MGVPGYYDMTEWDYLLPLGSEAALTGARHIWTVSVRRIRCSLLLSDDGRICARNGELHILAMLV